MLDLEVLSSPSESVCWASDFKDHRKKAVMLLADRKYKRNKMCSHFNTEPLTDAGSGGIIISIRVSLLGF